MVSTLSSKGQITLPKAIRDLCHLVPGDKVEFLVRDDGRIEMVPVASPLTRLKGMTPKPPHAVTLEEMDAAIRRRAGRT